MLRLLSPEESSYYLNPFSPDVWDNLEDSLKEKVSIIRDVVEEFSKANKDIEDYDIQYYDDSNPWVFVIFKYKDFEIKDELGKTYLLKGFYCTLTFEFIENELETYLNNVFIGGVKMMCNFQEYYSYYHHSHLSGMSYSDDTRKQIDSFCLGQGDINDTRALLAASFERDILELLLFQTDNFIRLETTRGYFSFSKLIRRVNLVEDCVKNFQIDVYKDLLKIALYELIEEDENFYVDFTVFKYLSGGFSIIIDEESESYNKLCKKIFEIFYERDSNHFGVKFKKVKRGIRERDYPYIVCMYRGDVKSVPGFNDNIDRLPLRRSSLYFKGERINFKFIEEESKLDKDRISYKINPSLLLLTTKYLKDFYEEEKVERIIHEILSDNCS